MARRSGCGRQPPQRCGNHGQEGQRGLLQCFKCFYQNRFFVIVLLAPRRLVDIIENRSNASNRRRLGR